MDYQQIQDTVVTFVTEKLTWEALVYTILGFVITEAAVWIPTFCFDYMAEPWKKYRTRQPTVYEQKVMDKVRKEQESKRLSSYWVTGWLFHFVTWSFSSMSFTDELPSLSDVVIGNFKTIFALDFYIYLLHWWLHWKNKRFGGHKIHNIHHAFRFVGCWYVDHEDPKESLCIAAAKYGFLAYWSPHPYSAFVYLWIVKYWNVIHHCGYNLPIFDFIDTYFPLIDTPNLHEIHHFHHLDGNYAVFFTCFDWIFGTVCHGDLEALTEFGHGVVKYDTEDYKDSITGARRETIIYKRASVQRRFRYNRTTKVSHLTEKQMEKLQAM